jgi:hypothetical protein
MEVLLTIGGNFPPLRSYTNLVKDELTGIPTKASTQTFKAIRYEGIV